MSTHRTLLVDGQVFQTTARDRGMGRYAICVLQALLKAKAVDIEIILTTHLPVEAEDEKVLKALFPGVTMHKLDLWTTQKHGIDSALSHNRTLLTNYVAQRARNQEQEIDYFIPSLFQEPLATTFPERGVRAKTLLFHDLIPYLYHERYKPVMMWDNYLKRFKSIFEADIIFANSQTVADDLNMYLGIPRSKLCRIDGAAIHIDPAVERPNIDLDGSFVLLNTSDDPRKNNLRTVLGFESWRMATNSDCKLVLTSTIHRREQERLRAFSKNLIFTGNIPERQLNWLYENCDLLLFAPESEGLGLPLLEAVAVDKKIVCSSIGVLREISPASDAFFYCDHENSYSIAKALEEATAPGAQINKKAYAAVKEYYTWPKTAQRMVAGLQHFEPRLPQPKPKLAIFTATPNGASGVSLTATVLHPALAEHFDIEYYFEPGLSGTNIRPNYLQYVVPSYPAAAFSAQRYAQYDAVVYHMGNGDYHLESVKNSLYLPGYVIVHDTIVREAYRVLNEAGMMAPERVLLEDKIDAAAGITMSSCYSSIANRQLGLLTHSTYASDAMKEALDADVSVVQTGLPTNVPVNNNVRISGEKLTIGLAGAIADVKGLDVIEAIADDLEFSDCNIRLFGFNHASQEKLDRLAAYENVSIATNVSDFDFQTSFAKLDIFVNYRMIYKGETSNTTLEAMRQGVVPIVRNVGWFSELANDVVVKVDSPEEVITKLRELIKDPAKLRAMGERAKQYTAEHFTQENYALKLKELLERDMSKNPNAPIAKALRAGSINSAAQFAEQIAKVK